MASQVASILGCSDGVEPRLLVDIIIVLLLIGMGSSHESLHVCERLRLRNISERWPRPRAMPAEYRVKIRCSSIRVSKWKSMPVTASERMPLRNNDERWPGLLQGVQCPARHQHASPEPQQG
jgi:hypothetical protein